jgi:hypothetical protein
VLQPVAADVVADDQLLISVLNSDTGLALPLADGVSWPILTIGTANLSTKFAGFVDEVAIYNTALTAARAQAHYLAGSAFTTHPTNYTTGPLGKSNVIPATNEGALFGIWSGISNVAESVNWAYLVDHIADIGRSPDIVGAQQETYTFDGVNTEDRIHSLGAVPVIALGEGETGDMYDNFTPVEIIAGAADTSLNTLADRYAACDYRIMVAPAREFEGTIPIDTSQQQQDFREAWQYMVNRFQARGATNVGWYWTPGEHADSGGLRAKMNLCYPGHEYVDWVGSTGYCQDRVSVNNTPMHNLWAEFREIFSYGAMGAPYTSIAEMFGSDKPYVVAETGCLYSNTNITTRKRDWLKNIDDVAKPAMSGLRGVIYFGYALGNEECFVDWRAYSNCRAQDCFECGGADPNCAGLVCGANGTFDQTSWDGYLYWAGRERWNVGVLGGP